MIDFAWGDIDGDGDPDATFIDDSHRLHVFANERQGLFAERELPPNFQTVRAVR